MVKQKLSRHSLKGRRWILWCPISRWTTKDWPLDNYEELARRLPEDVMLVFAGSEELRSHSSRNGLPARFTYGQFGW